MSSTPKPGSAPPPGLGPGTAEARIGLAWRELRRGAATQVMRERLYSDLLEPAQVDALDVVVSTDGCRMAELAADLRVDRSTATRVVDRLVAEGVVTRHEASGDGRGVRVVATERGRELYEEFSARRRGMLVAVLAGFEAAEREVLADLLERLVAGIDRYTERVPAPLVG
jgi:DNA-binding MarR family transcriptional regulator